MNCLCCGKVLRSETASGWHPACIKRFFGTKELPEIELSNEMLQKLTIETVNKGYTVPGVQRKMSLHLVSKPDKPRLTLVNYPTGYILKPPVKEYEALPESEQLVMSMADCAGIQTVPHALIRGSIGLAYITKRIDRQFEEEQVRMLAMEDFCQLDLRLTEDKYRGSYERCAKIIQRYSSRVGIDVTEIFSRIVFSFLIGNSDMHLKNFSLIETAEGSGVYILSPAYDLLPTNIIIPQDAEQFALPMNGKKMNLRRNDFLKFADECNIQRSVANKIIDRMVGNKSKWLEMCANSPLPDAMRAQFGELIEARCSTLTK